jgi:uncharacterized protein
MNAIDEREVALRFLAHVERRELGEAMRLCANDLRVWLPGHPELTAAQLHEFLALSLERMTTGSFALQPVGTTAEGERVAVEAHSRALLRNGDRYENRYHFLFTVREGRIRSLNAYAAGDFAVAAAWAQSTTERSRFRLYSVGS